MLEASNIIDSHWLLLQLIAYFFAAETFQLHFDGPVRVTFQLRFYGPVRSYAAETFKLRFYRPIRFYAAETINNAFLFVCLVGLASQSTTMVMSNRSVNLTTHSLVTLD